MFNIKAFHELFLQGIKSVYMFIFHPVKEKIYIALAKLNSFKSFDEFSVQKTIYIYMMLQLKYTQGFCEMWT